MTPWMIPRAARSARGLVPARIRRGAAPAASAPGGQAGPNSGGDREHAPPVWFRPLFVLYGAAALTWLAVGAIPAIAAQWPGLHAALHDGGALGARIARASHLSHSPAQSALDYAFSILNLGLAALLVVHTPSRRPAQLLAIAMVGTAVSFNLQGHAAAQVFPRSWMESGIDAWHIAVHIVSGICYVFALLLFPDDKLYGRGPARGLRLVLLAAAVAMFSLFATDDHATGLVFVFGVITPVAAIGAQMSRVRRAERDDVRRRARSLLIALAIAFVTAVGLNAVTAVAEERREHVTVDYELETPAPGTYFFLCDPHLDMRGTVEVVAARDASARTRLAIGARDSRFDKPRIVLPARRDVVIRFTNYDADRHNVSIYRDPGFEEPVFVGELFSGRVAAGRSFRVFRTVFAVIPVALFFGLVRFRLWDMDRVVNRTLVYGLLAGLITAVYVALVVGVGTLAGTRGRPNVALTMAVAAIAAVAFQPARDRITKVADRVVYGRRATPYEVIARFAREVGTTYELNDVGPRMARMLAEATSAQQAEVWLAVGDELVATSSWPTRPPGRSVSLPSEEGAIAAAIGADVAVPVRHRGRLLGALAVSKREPLNSAENALLDDVATQAALVLGNVQLTEELRARIRDLRASRQRIVAAQDLERRRIERDLHDGAQQQLVGLTIGLQRAEELARTDPAAAQQLLTELRAGAAEAIDSLRALARGIYPTLLGDRGVVAALRAHGRRSPLDVDVSGGDDRYPPDVETAVYFCCAEAMQNAAKHAPGSHVAVEVASDGTRITFSVTDDGPGFDPDGAGAGGTGLHNMRDRVAALGGDVVVRSATGDGTSIRGWVPLPAADGSPADQGGLARTDES